MVEVMFPSHQRPNYVIITGNKKMNTNWRQVGSSISLNSTNKIYRALMKLHIALVISY